VALWDGQELSAELIQRADAAMYRAKAGGRARSVVDAGRPAALAAEGLRRHAAARAAAGDAPRDHAALTGGRGRARRA
jgi:hypothetical protein